mgnify:FL=1
MSPKSVQTLYASRMGARMAVRTPEPTAPVTSEPALVSSYSSTEEMALDLNVRLQLQNAEATTEPAIAPVEQDDDDAPRIHGRGSVEHLGKEIEKLGKQMGRKIRQLAKDLDLDKADRAELKDMVHDLKHDLKDAFKRVDDDDDHDHRERSQRPDAAEAYTGAADALAEFAARLAAFAERVTGIQNELIDEPADEPVKDPSLLPVEPKPDVPVEGSEFTLAQA